MVPFSYFSRELLVAMETTQLSSAEQPIGQVLEGSCMNGIVILSQRLLSGVVKGWWKWWFMCS